MSKLIMGLFFEKRVQRQGNKEFDVIRVKRGRAWTICWFVLFVVLIMSIRFDNEIASLIAFALLFLLVIVGLFEGGATTFRQSIAPFAGYEYRVKGKFWSNNDPLETWVERKK